LWARGYIRRAVLNNACVGKYPRPRREEGRISRAKISSRVAIISLFVREQREKTNRSIDRNRDREREREKKKKRKKRTERARQRGGKPRCAPTEIDLAVALRRFRRRVPAVAKFIPGRRRRSFLNNGILNSGCFPEVGRAISQVVSPFPACARARLSRIYPTDAHPSLSRLRRGGGGRIIFKTEVARPRAAYCGRFRLVHARRTRTNTREDARSLRFGRVDSSRANSAAHFTRFRGDDRARTIAR